MTQESALVVQLQVPSGDWIEVGYLHNYNERNWFEFTDSYWNLGHRPILGQIFEEYGRAWKPSAHTALPHWFSHLLPEGRLRSAVANAAAVSSKREFDLLRRIGATDLPGAIRAVPADGPGSASTLPDAAVADESDQDDPLLKFSLAGAQLKFSVYGNGRGLTVPASGQAGNVILKFPDGRPGFSGVPEAELACLELARASGIDTPQAKLIVPSEVKGLEDWARHADGGMALAVQRFDRAGSIRVHMEELAQILNIPTARQTAKYRRANLETVALVVSALCGLDTVGEVIDRIVLNILVGNGDAHLKNWAVSYSDSKRPSLSPMYDVLPTTFFVADDDMGLNLDKSKIFENVSVKSFDRLGARSGFGVAHARERVTEAVERILSSWSVLDDYLSADLMQFLDKRRQTLTLSNRPY
ncbi:MAG: type II toxin-antitoxin system HipA family toxin [Pseudonocardiaceae bacterium]